MARLRCGWLMIETHVANSRDMRPKFRDGVAILRDSWLSLGMDSFVEGRLPS
jgi:hypothetical protein